MAFVIASPEVSSIYGCRRRRFMEASSTILSKPHPRNTNFLKNLRTSSNVGFRARVSASVIGSEQNVGLHGKFSAGVRQGPSAKQEQEDEERRNYYLNTGHAIRTLREEFPELFYRNLSYDIYRDDIVFKDPLYTFVGIDNYKSIFKALRFHGKMFFKALWIDIVSVWQPVESIIMIRWTVHGIPRVPWESRGRFDGVSEYKLDKDGKIYEHRVHNIALKSPPKFRVISVQEIINSLGCPSTPKPTFFEISSSYVKDFMSLFLKFLRTGNHLDCAAKLAKVWEAELRKRT